MKRSDPLDDLTPAVKAFADRVFEAFDVGEVVTAAAAARATWIEVSTARDYIVILKSARCWPYRGAWWKTRADAVGPFVGLAERRAS